jgi:CO/xanthine dehydrogenase FAD-binding subunit
MTEYLAPENLAHALEALADGATVIAGGTDLMLELRRLRLRGEEPPLWLVDVSRLPELNRLELDNERPFVGSAVTFGRLERDSQVRQRYPLLAETAASFGSPQIRSLATIGGNVANASPAADGVTALTALGARARIIAQQGVRHVPLEDLITGPNETSMAPGELIVGFDLEPPRGGEVQRFHKIGRRRAVVIARVNLAVRLRRDLAESRVVLGACFPSPRRLTEVEDLLASGSPGPRLWEEAGRIAADRFTTLCGWRPSSRYKVPGIARLVAATLESAWKEAGGKG